MKRAKRLLDIAMKYVDADDFYAISIRKRSHITMQGELTSEKLKKYKQLGFVFKINDDTGHVNGIWEKDIGKL